MCCPGAARSLPRAHKAGSEHFCSVFENQARDSGRHDNYSTLTPRFPTHSVQDSASYISSNLMDCLLRLLHLGRVPAQPRRPAAVTPSASRRDSLFEGLPVELILEVAAWLPPSSATLLSLCNHKLHEMLGQRSLRGLNQSNPSHNEQALFLQALDRDLPDTLYCFWCNKLHVLLRKHEDKLEAEELYKRVSKGRCLSADGTYNYGTTYTHHAGFKFEHVQMAMKLYRRGLVADAKAFLTRSAFLQPARGRMTSLPSFEGLYLFEPRLVNGKIFVRTQSWIFNPGEQGAVVPRKHYTTVCAHLDGDPPYQNPYTAVFRHQLEHLAAKQVSCQDCRRLISCHYCSTEVYIEAKRLEGDSKGGLLVITKWQLLGCGLSPSEVHWKSHLELPELPWLYLPDRAPGSIQASYEDQPGTKYDSLLQMAEAWRMLNERS